LDIGGTKTDAVAVDHTGRVVQQLRLATGFGSAAVLETAVDAVERLAVLLDLETGDFESVGVGIPGAVDVESGRVSHAVNLGVDELLLGGELSARLGVSVQVENDVNAAAVGAFHLFDRAEPDHLDSPEAHSMAYLNLGTGLAAGLVLGGRLWRGSRGTAGEIGHIPVDPTGPLCPCGQRGCLEMMASGSAVARQWPSSDASPVHALFHAADGGDPSAAEVRARLLENVAAAVRVLVLTVDVNSVVIGGGLSAVGQPLLDGVREVLDAWALSSPFLDSLGLTDRVHLLPAGFSAAAVGAALVGMTTSGAAQWRKW
jgi:predicted NBD/HSP70 family sugar kinase